VPFGITFDIPGLTGEQYDRLVLQLSRLTAGQPGFLVHLSGPTETGYRVTEVWQSAEDQERFVDEQVAPLFEQEGVPPAHVETFAVETVIVPLTTEEDGSPDI